MVTVDFDAEAGRLRLDHAALSVLAALAVRPTDPALHDHAVAPVVTALRAAGLVGRGGMDDAVAPLMRTVGAARARYRLSAVDHGTPRRAALWVGEDLVVVGVEEPDGAYALMGDRHAAAAGLVAELVGLAPSPEPEGAGAVTVRAADLLALLTAGPEQVPATDVLTGAEARDPEWVARLARVADGASVHWMLHHLATGPGDGRTGDPSAEPTVPAPLPVIVVVDAGAQGLWAAQPLGDSSDDLQLAPTSPRTVMAMLNGHLAAPL